MSVIIEQSCSVWIFIHIFFFCKKEQTNFQSPERRDSLKSRSGDLSNIKVYSEFIQCLFRVYSKLKKSFEHCLGKCVLCSGYNRCLYTPCLFYSFISVKRLRTNCYLLGSYSNFQGKVSIKVAFSMWRKDLIYLYIYWGIRLSLFHYFEFVNICR